MRHEDVVTSQIRCSLFPAVALIVEMQCAMGAFGSGVSHVELKKGGGGASKEGSPHWCRIRGRFAIDKCLSGTPRGFLDGGTQGRLRR